MSDTDPVVSIADLTVEFRTEIGVTEALRGVSFEVARGRTTAIVGESGSGKSVTAQCIMRLIEPPGYITGGSIVFAPRDREPYEVVTLRPRDPRLGDLRGGKVSMVFQEPMTAFSPVHTIGNQVAEAVLTHEDVSKTDAWQRAVAMLERVGIADAAQRAHQYPFEFSGGMRQRGVIAMALVSGPELLICDEPTTALDVTVQAEILALIKTLTTALGTSVIFITHDLGVVAQIADDVVVMYGGRILEAGDVRQVLKHPVHPYTRGLIAAIPGRGGDRRRLDTIDSVIGDLDLSAQHPLTTLIDGRRVSLPGDLIPRILKP